MSITKVLQRSGGVALAAVIAAASLPLHAQASAASTVDPWTPFLGCWSTSSAGTIGPMVCVVPGDSAQRVEFMTVAGDSIVGRTIIDASGQPRAQQRAECIGWEKATWSDDARRLYVHADYRCLNGAHQRSDAIIAMTRSDAFTQVEGTLGDRSTRTSVVNFIVQLDTTSYPIEVKRRLGNYRALSMDGQELESLTAVSAADVMDAARNVDPAVVRAWLEDRGDRADLALADLRTLRLASAGVFRTEPQRVPYPRARSFLARGYQLVPASLMDFDLYRGETFPTNIIVTPSMVNFAGTASGVPGSRSFTWRGWP